MDRRQKEADHQAGEGESFESHFGLFAGADERDEEWKGNRDGRHCHAGQERDQKRQKENHDIYRHVHLGEERDDIVNGVARFKVELEQQGTENQKDEVGFESRFKNP